MDEALPLRGIRVFELCSVAAGPFCGMLLADLGADVIKVENPRGGDTMRQWPPLTNGYSENFASLNRNKRSVTLDLKVPSDRSRASRLLSTADVVLENNRPGVMARLGLDYPSLKARNRGLIYCSISAFGQEGPRATEGGFDVTVQAISGVMSVTGEPEGAPVKCGVPVSDFSAGLYAALAITATLHQRRETGEGAYIDVSMLGASLGIAALQTSEYFGTGRNPRKLASAHPRNAPYQAFRARDGHFVLAAGNDNLWELACKAIRREDLCGDPQFATTATRAANQDALRQILEAEFAQFDCKALIERFTGAGVPCAPINGYADALSDPQVQFMGWVQELELPDGSLTRTFGSPVRLSGRSVPIGRRPPALGEHNDEVFAELDQASTGPS
ncbi:MAG TPA: CoA transferase [Myxococcaceae bacterium]|nr:CoA transferase [Myxococcaceae bacterium]